MEPSNVDSFAWLYQLGAGLAVLAAVAFGIWRAWRGSGESRGPSSSTGDSAYGGMASGGSSCDSAGGSDGGCSGG